jgi:thiamine-monophosphate kinase
VNVSDLGEFGLIERLAKAVGAERPESLIVGIGDDAAAWRVDGAVVLATTDTLVEGVHFLLDLTPWADLGWKALAVNVSDIAAMGGEPQYALVTLGLPPQTPVQGVDALYEGLQECAREYGVAIAGGDVVRAPQVMISVALTGQTDVDADGSPRLMRRDAARAGYAIAVTGTLGRSVAGLRRLKEGAPAEDRLARAHLRPWPPLALARRAVQLGVPCAIDVSDGLLQDLGHVCEMSELGAVVRAATVPLSDELRDAYPDDALALACAGGEDYELLLIAPRETLAALGSEVSVIGEMVESAQRQPRVVDESENEVRLPAAGWDHLRT